MFNHLFRLAKSYKKFEISQIKNKEIDFNLSILKNESNYNVEKLEKVIKAQHFLIFSLKNTEIRNSDNTIFLNSFSQASKLVKFLSSDQIVRLAINAGQARVQSTNFWTEIDSVLAQKRVLAVKKRDLQLLCYSLSQGKCESQIIWEKLEVQVLEILNGPIELLDFEGNYFDKVNFCVSVMKAFTKIKKGSPVLMKTLISQIKENFETIKGNQLKDVFDSLTKNYFNDQELLEITIRKIIDSQEITSNQYLNFLLNRVLDFNISEPLLSEIENFFISLELPNLNFDQFGILMNKYKFTFPALSGKRKDFIQTVVNFYLENRKKIVSCRQNNLKYQLAQEMSIVNSIFKMNLSISKANLGEILENMEKNSSVFCSYRKEQLKTIQNLFKDLS